LLNLVTQHNVEAIFSGHVHNFLYNHHLGTEMYVLPSTGFVRPDYSELAAIAPESEGGRDDPAKLGFFVVDVAADGHRIRPIRTYGATSRGEATPVPEASIAAEGWRCPVGVTLRHGWMSSVDFPTAGLDEFQRKTVRDDSLLPTLWEARIADVRIPIGDIGGSEQRERIRHLSGRGMRFTIRSAGVPDESTLIRVGSAAELLQRWEIVLWPHQYSKAFAALRESAVAVPVAVAPIVPLGDGEVHHFVSSGFSADDAAGVAALIEADTSGVVDEIVFRVRPGADVASALTAAAELAMSHRRTAMVNAELPRAGEAVPFVDDAFLGDWVEQVARAAAGMPDVAVFLDGFVDHDRSYYPRVGLVDRRSNPRPALHRLIAVSVR
jgi:hypothetical protein